MRLVVRQRTIIEKPIRAMDARRVIDPSDETEVIVRIHGEGAEPPAVLEMSEREAQALVDELVGAIEWETELQR